MRDRGLTLAALGLMCLVFSRPAWAEPPDPASAVPPGSAATFLGDWICFYAGFDQATVHPDLAAGDAEPRLLYGSLQFEAGILGHSLRVGAGGAEVGFATPRNLELAKPGALSMWVMPRTWKDTGSAYLPLIRIFGAGQAVFVIERDVRSAGEGERDRIITGPSGLSGGRQVLMFRPLPGRWRNGEWHLLALDWDAMGFALSIDGAPFVREAAPGGTLPHTFQANASPQGFVIGNRGQEATLMDELVVYQRPLTDEEAVQLFSRPKTIKR